MEYTLEDLLDHRPDGEDDLDGGQQQLTINRPQNQQERPSALSPRKQNELPPLLLLRTVERKEEDPASTRILLYSVFTESRCLHARGVNATKLDPRSALV